MIAMIELEIVCRNKLQYAVWDRRAGMVHITHMCGDGWLYGKCHIYMDCSIAPHFVLCTSVSPVYGIRHMEIKEVLGGK